MWAKYFWSSETADPAVLRGPVAMDRTGETGAARTSDDALPRKRVVLTPAPSPSRQARPVGTGASTASYGVARNRSTACPVPTCVPPHRWLVITCPDTTRVRDTRVRTGVRQERCPNCPGRYQGVPLTSRRKLKVVSPPRPRGPTVRIGEDFSARASGLSPSIRSAPTWPCSSDGAFRNSTNHIEFWLPAYPNDIERVDPTRAAPLVWPLQINLTPSMASSH